MPLGFTSLQHSGACLACHAACLFAGCATGCASSAQQPAISSPLVPPFRPSPARPFLLRACRSGCHMPSLRPPRCRYWLCPRKMPRRRARRRRRSSLQRRRLQRAATRAQVGRQVCRPGRVLRQCRPNGRIPPRRLPGLAFTLRCPPGLSRRHVRRRRHAALPALCPPCCS